uniref:Uncharacterized protein n=1 Tax=Anguilla anguilla TaxID=7936 RepID=A0A0E9XE93_ANGAN
MPLHCKLIVRTEAAEWQKWKN